MVVAHGDTIWRTLASFLGIDASAIGHGIANTSVSGLKVSADGSVSLDFINRTPHLVGYEDDRRNEEFYTFMGLKKKKLRPVEINLLFFTGNLLENTGGVLRSARGGSEHPTSVLSGRQPATF